MIAVSDYRRENLRQLVAKHGGPRNLGGMLGYTNGSFLVQMTGPAPIRDVSERTARSFEQKLGLPAGVLDQPVDVINPLQLPQRRAYKHDVAPLPVFNIENLKAVIQAIGKISDEEEVSLSPLKFSDILVLSIEGATANNSEPNLTKIRTLVRLAK